jgi:hypothetical protein
MKLFVTIYVVYDIHTKCFTVYDNPDRHSNNNNIHINTHTDEHVNYMI